MILAQGLTYRSMEQNKESRNSPTYRWSVNFWKKVQRKIDGGKDSFFDRFSNRAIGYSKSPACEQFLFQEPVH